jgi:two-component sensor histidine kinase
MTVHTHSSDLRNSIPVSLCEEADLRIAKSLTMISGLVRLRAYQGIVVDPRALLLEIADRIDSVAELHRLLSQSTTGTVQLSKHLQEICARSADALSPGRMICRVTCSPEHVVPFSLAMPLGLITAELLSNSLRYAHPAGLPTRVEIVCSRGDGNTLTLNYQDDGVGFPENFELSRDGRLGMKLIKSLSDRLEGDHTWSSDSLGMNFEMVAPMSGFGS